MLTRVNVWWNAVITFRVKHAILNAFVFFVLIASFQVQTSHLYKADIRTNRNTILAIEHTQAVQDYNTNLHDYQDCVHRVKNRDDLRVVVFSMVNLALVFPDSETAKLYTQTQIALIESNYPKLDIAECGTKPIKP